MSTTLNVNTFSRSRGVDINRIRDSTVIKFTGKKKLLQLVKEVLEESMRPLECASSKYRCRLSTSMSYSS